MIVKKRKILFVNIFNYVYLYMQISYVILQLDNQQMILDVVLFNDLNEFMFDFSYIFFYF